MSKIKFENCGFLELPDGDSPDAGKGLRPFVPHPSQVDELNLSSYIVAKARGSNYRSFENFVVGYSFPLPKELIKHGESIRDAHFVIDEIQNRMVREFNQKKEIYLKENLASLGFKFSKQEEFYNFIEKRVRRVVSQEDEEVAYYLDFKSENNRGTLIGITNENRFRLNWEGNKLIGTIG